MYREREAVRVISLPRDVVSAEVHGTEAPVLGIQHPEDRALSPGQLQRPAFVGLRSGNPFTGLAHVKCWSVGVPATALRTGRVPRSASSTSESTSSTGT